VIHPLDDAVDDAEQATLCYHALGKVHGVLTPLPSTLKDYISSPKPNGYRSLHTTVLVGTQPLEIQIRTLAMHHVAEFGAAAHWAYKGSTASLPWLQIIDKWRDLDCAHAFMQLVRQELLGTRVFVFTGDGQILNLARGATLEDAVQPLGASLETHAPRINGAFAMLSTRLNNGDIVSFQRIHEQPELETAEEGSGGDALDLVSGWSVCENCLPLPGDALIGAAEDASCTSGTVHRDGMACSTLRRQLAAGQQTLLAKHAQGGLLRRVLKAHLTPEMMSAKIVVLTRDRPGILLAVSSVVTAHTVNIVDVHSETQAVGLASAFQYNVHLASMEQLDELVLAVRTLPDVVDVVRGSMADMMEDNLDGFWAMAEPTDEL